MRDVLNKMMCKFLNLKELNIYPFYGWANCTEYDNKVYACVVKGEEYLCPIVRSDFKLVATKRGKHPVTGKMNTFLLYVN